MKKRYVCYFTLFILAVIFLSPSCKKESDPVITTPEDSVIILPPSVFTKKVLAENFLSTTCGYCSYGIGDLHYTDSLFPGKVVSVTFHGHGNDPMVTPLYAMLGTYFHNTIIPAGGLNRIHDSFNEPIINFPLFIGPELDSAATCGLAINATAVHDSIATIEIKAAFNQQVSGDLRLVAYLVEDSVTGGTLYGQQNWNCSTCSDPDPNSYFYNLPSFIYPYYHRDVFRKQITPDDCWGEPIPTSVIHAQGEFKKTYSVNTGSLPGKFYIVAFITKHGADYLSHHVLNVQKTKLGFNKNYD